LDRPTRTLSGGETERVNLTTCLGTRLVNTLFVLDEPSVGLHPRDTDRLVRILEKLRDTGNTVVVVEHEASVMRAADQIVDLGPGHGAAGGEIVFQGSLPELLQTSRSLTGQYLSGRKRIEIPKRRPVTLECGDSSPLSKGVLPPSNTQQAGKATRNVRRGAALRPDQQSEPSGGKSSHSETPRSLVLHNASCHNLKNLSVEIPLQRLVTITGVSGSGKSTLVRDILLPALEGKLRSTPGHPQSTVAKASDCFESDESSVSSEGDDSAPRTPHSAFISGFESLHQVVLVDQSALGKTPRSNPAVYIGAFDDIREVFAQSEVARQRGLNASAFSFNSGVGQCEKCRGAGFEKIEMQFLSDVFIRCPACNGRRYREHILEVKLNGASAHSDKSPQPKAARAAWSIADLLEATVDEAIDFLSGFAQSKPAQRAVARLRWLQEVGLGYLRLGQPINTLSGGESQRLKLVRHLAEAGDCRTGVAPVADSGLSNQGAGDRRDAGPALFLFDEPTTGLHFEDVRVLLQVFQRLVDAGHSVVVIEHNLDVIKCADWVIDLGPEAGDGGGRIVAAGTPETVARCEASHTGRFLKSVLSKPQTSEGHREPLTRRDATLPLNLVAADASPLHLNPAKSQSRLTSAATVQEFKARWYRGSLSPTGGEDGVRGCAQADEQWSNPSSITITGAREHNLKNISLDIPRDQFVVITGVSGSGKSTLAFDLLFNEGQRRFLDSMNLYARQFVEQMARSDVDLLTGIPPTVSIEQRTTRGGGKSTVATVTELYHFIRLLFARLGTPYCPDCQLPVEAQTRDELAAHLRGERGRRGELTLLAPVVRNRKGFHTDVAEWAAQHGYREIRADGRLHDTRRPFRLDRFKEHDVEIVVGRLEGGRGGVPEKLIEQTLKLGNGTLFALDGRGQLTVHSAERACPGCGKSFAPLDPKNFSYNSSQGWCPRCRGFGELFYLPDVERGANADAIEESWWSWANEREVCPDCQGARLNPVARAVRLRCGAPISRSARSPKPSKRDDRALGDPTIEAFTSLDVEAALNLVRTMKFTGRAAEIARDILPEIRERLRFLREVGLGYLQLGRAVPTLSGGEAQRIRLAAQLGSNLSGVLYVLDEPTIGLHARDNEQLLDVLEKLRGRGNSVVVVEHDEDTMRRADHVIDLGPGAGVHGGQVVASGTLAELAKHPESITGQCLRAEKQFPARGERRATAVGPASRLASAKKEVRAGRDACPTLTLRHAAVNNLKNLEVHFPLGRFVVVTGVSGSGKSTLVRECLLPAVESALAVGRASARATPPKSRGRSRKRPPHLSGFESLQAVYEVDQSPIGRTPRSIPATYVGFFDDIRALFAQVPEARMRGYSPSRFSFNSAQGRCPECEGAGQIKLEMNFLPPAFVRCETCNGTRFNRETLDIEYAGKNIAQVLELSVEEAIGFFAGLPRIKRALEALHDTGLDYLKLGQQSPTLSGGEAQRVKLVTHLLGGLKPAGADNIQRATFNPQPAKLFILEEPTIGLHLADVRRLVEVLQRLVDAGHSVIVIEHNLELIAEADWVIDLGPEGGDGGGRIVVAGTPEQVARNPRSHTGRFLRKLFAKS